MSIAAHCQQSNASQNPDPIALFPCVLIRQLGVQQMTVYFSGAALLFSIYMTAFLRDSSTSKSDVASWIVIAIATLLWPITLPISLKELTPKAVRALQPTRRAELAAAANQ
jgi:hypothetical protein